MTHPLKELPTSYYGFLGASCGCDEYANQLAQSGREVRAGQERAKAKLYEWGAENVGKELDILNTLFNRRDA